MTRRLAWALALLSALLLAVAALAVFLGSARLSPLTVLHALGAGADSTERIVVLGLRLPRIAAAVLAGGALAVAGVGFQGLTRNPLAEPSVLGVSAGASFGVVLGQLAGGGDALLDTVRVAAFGFGGALLAGAAVYLIASAHGAFPVQTLLLAGVIVGIFFGAAVTVLISLVDVDRLGGVVHWLLGNVAPLPGRSLLVFALVAALGFAAIVSRARELNVLALGEEQALQLGVNAERVKAQIFAAAALLTSSVVTFAGPIGFVGLIVPHMLRLVLGPDNRVLVPTAMVGGGTFLLVADTIARNAVAPAELSVGIITSFFGAPFFVYLLLTRRGNL
jgi:iron complex transport system permease protein